MKIVIRTDASLVIGTGHVMRCKTLAEELHRRGAEVVFVCRDLRGNLIPLLKKYDFIVKELPTPKAINPVQAEKSDDYSAWLGVEQSEDVSQTIEALGDFEPDWLVVDHYGLDESWEQGLRGRVDKILVIDDLVNRPHDCDVLLNQNLLDDLDNAYQGLVPNGCRKLLGPRFALLRREFREAREMLRDRDGMIRRTLVFFGGVDPTSETEKALKALEMLGRPDLAVDVVVGSNNPQGEKIEAICRCKRNVTFHRQVSNMAELMSCADLAIGAGGTASWERCCMGLPALVTIIADNQSESTLQLANRGAVRIVGITSEVEPLDYKVKISALTPDKLKTMQTNGFDLVDGRGIDRVILSISNEPMELRLATFHDAEKVWGWRNHPKTRLYFWDPSPVGLHKHRDWWDKSLEDKKRILLLGKKNGIDCGVIRYDLIDDYAAVSIYLDPALHGLGLGRTLLRSGEDWLNDQPLKLSLIQAQVLPKNFVSQKMFSAQGFRKDASGSKWFKRINRN